jgi:hypothetical protein
MLWPDGSVTGVEPALVVGVVAEVDGDPPGTLDEADGASGLEAGLSGLAVVPGSPVVPVTSESDDRLLVPVEPGAATTGEVVGAPVSLLPLPQATAPATTRTVRAPIPARRSFIVGRA